MFKYLLFLALFFSFASSAQIAQTFRIEHSNKKKKRTLNLSDLENLKKTTTLFTLPSQYYGNKAAYEKAIKDVWTITPFQIIKIDEVDSYVAKGGYSVFSFDSYYQQTEYSNGIGGIIAGMVVDGINESRYYYYNLDIYYDLLVSHKKKNGKITWRIFARIHTYPDNEQMYEYITSNNKISWIGSNTALNGFLYKDADIYNWQPGFMRGYLKFINDRLIGKTIRETIHENKRKVFLSIPTIDSNAFFSLKNDTLYLPDYVKVRFRAVDGNKIIDESDLRKDYPYPLKFVSAEELNDLISNRDKPIKYLVFTKTGSGKNIDVYNSADNKLIYSIHSLTWSYDFKSDDLERIAEKIKQ